MNPIRYIQNVLTNRQYFWHFFWMMLLGECALGCLFIRFVPYTEIDWKAYMDEVEGAITKTLDYTQLRGETGPLVYPAGFVYIYSLLYYLTDGGVNIRLAQYVFLGLYLATEAVVMILYHRSKVVPQWAMLFLALSKRLKSIYYLRLFNESVLMLPVYLSFLLFTYQQWFWGMLLLSISLSIKMNVLLFFPAVLLLLFESVGVTRAILLLVLCPIVQIVLGAPFIVTNPMGYFSRAFEFSRTFTYKWTVNFKFLPYEIFVSPKFGALLLLLQLSLLLCFIFFRWTQPMGGIWRVVQSDPFAPKPRNLLVRAFDWFCIRVDAVKLTPEHILTTLFISNFIGVVCSRSLHYQYYCWYAATLPYLLWRTEIPDLLKPMLLLSIEVAYNVYPSTPASSLLLQVAHWVLLLCLWLRKCDISCRIVDWGSFDSRKKTGRERKEE